MTKIIYFDNAATSNFKPRCVKKEFNKALDSSANPGRSGHKLSLKNAMKVWNTREIIASHFGLENAENVIFTKNCTEALNIAIQGLLKTGNHVICSCFEHNSVLRPLKTLERLGKISLTIIEPNNKQYITKSDVEKAILPNTYLVCLTHTSNVTGEKQDIESIGKFLKQKKILFLVDFAQGCGHYKIDMKKYNINYLAFAGHKGFFAPQGIGGLVINSKTLPSPILFGGTGTESENLYQPSVLPESLESGTLATPLICALGVGIKYVEKHIKKHSKRIFELTEYLIKNLKELEKNNKVVLYTHKPSFSGVVSFNVANKTSVEVTDYLDEKYNIATRGGLHCAPLTHKFLGTIQNGAVRVSLSHKNTKRQINKLLKAVLEIS